MRTHSLADLPGAIHGFADWLDKRTRKLDRLFWHKVRMARLGPDVHFAVNHEIEEPYRVGRVIVLHLEPFRTGLAIGWYGKTGLPEHEALLRAITTQQPTQRDFDDFDDDVLQRPGGLRFSASYRSAVERRGPGPGVDDPRHDGAGQ